MTVYNNITNDFYNSLYNIGSNPFVLLVLVIIIIIYYALFSSLGKSNSYETSDNSSYAILEALLWGIFILLIFFNGMSYFFNIDVIAEIKNLFSNEPEILIKSKINNNLPDIQETTTPTTINEVFHIPGNRFSYHDAKAVCKSLNSELATYNQLKEAQTNGASWCSYGWTENQLALYPTSQSDFDMLQNKKGHEYDCGLPGINGGYLANTYTNLGANCYGVKPKKSELEKQLFDNKNNNNLPKSYKEKIFNDRVDYWKQRTGNILISPFNNDTWYKI